MQHVVELHRELLEFVLEVLPLADDVELTVEFDDGRAAVERAARTGGGYDLAIVDVFSGSVSPRHMSTVEFFRELDQLLAPDAVVVVNTLATAGLDMSREVAATLASIHADVLAVASPAVVEGSSLGNVVLAASAAPLPGEAILRARGHGPAADRAAARRGARGVRRRRARAPRRRPAGLSMRAGRAALACEIGCRRLVALGVAAALLAPPAVAASADREPSIGPGLEWVAHRDNPFRQGDDADFINSDLAFTGDYLVQGNYAGFSIWDIADPAAPELVSAVSCPGGQGDVSTVGNLVLISIDETMSDDSCEAARVPETEENWEGLRVFDISDPRAPRYAAAVRTRCGGHTHTVVPDPASTDRVFVYMNAYSRGASLNCTGRNPLQIIEVPLAAPEDAAIVGELDLFDDETAFGPEDRVAGGAETRSTTGCHDITAYPAKGLAVAACRGDGLLLSIADPLAPVVLQRVRDPAVAFWHSGIFDNDATRVVFQDELGDGFINTCSPAFGADRGADAVWLIQPDGLVKAGTYKLPRVAVRPREVRRALRRARAGARAVHHRAGVARGRRLGRRPHRPGGARGADLVRSARLRVLDGLHGGHLVGVPLRRLPLRERHVRGPRGAAAHRPDVRGCRPVRRRGAEPADAAGVLVGVARGAGRARRRGASAPRSRRCRWSPPRSSRRTPRRSRCRCRPAP